MSAHVMTDICQPDPCEWKDAPTFVVFSLSKPGVAVSSGYPMLMPTFVPASYMKGAPVSSCAVLSEA